MILRLINMYPNIPNMKVSLLTPSGGRPKQLKLCRRWVENQRVSNDIDIEHIVVENDKALIADNLLKCLEEATGDIIMIIEDDDYYSPEYVSRTLSSFKDNAVLVGESRRKRYHFPSRKYLIFNHNLNSALNTLAFKSDEFADKFRHILKWCSKKKNQFVDQILWNSVISSNYPSALSRGDAYCVGIKGLVGRNGAGALHSPDKLSLSDECFDVFKEWLGVDSYAYFYEYLRLRSGERPLFD